MGWLALIASLPLSRKGTERLTQGASLRTAPAEDQLLARPALKLALDESHARRAHGSLCAFAVLRDATAPAASQFRFRSSVLRTCCSRVVVPARGSACSRRSSLRATLCLALSAPLSPSPHSPMPQSKSRAAVSANALSVSASPTASSVFGHYCRSCRFRPWTQDLRDLVEIG